MASEGSSRRSFLSTILAGLAGCLALRPGAAQAQHGSAKCLPANPSDTQSLIVFDYQSKRVIKVEEMKSKTVSYDADGTATETWHNVTFTSEIDDVGNTWHSYRFND